MVTIIKATLAAVSVSILQKMATKMLVKKMKLRPYAQILPSYPMLGRLHTHIRTHILIHGNDMDMQPVITCGTSMWSERLELHIA